MKKIWFLFVLLFVFSSLEVFAQSRSSRSSRSSSRRSRGNSFSFSQDTQERIKAGCVNVMKKAGKFQSEMRSRGTSSIHSGIVYMCSVNSIKIEQPSLGPWEKFVYALEKIFNQFKALLYVAAVFMLVWLFVKAAYEAEMNWMHFAMLIMGVVMLGFADVFLDIATNRVTLDDVKSGEMYVDCRKPDDGLYPCNLDTEGVMDKESVYLFTVNQTSGDSKLFKGLY